MVLVGVAAAVACTLLAGGMALLLRGEPIPRRALLRLDLRGDLPEESRLGVFERLLGWQEVTVRELVAGIDAAAADARVHAALVRLGDLEIGLARAQEIRQALARFRAAERRLAVVLEAGGPTEYYIASVADDLYVAPGGNVDVTGLVAELPFLRGTLDRIGVAADFERIGEDKDSPDIYMREEMSPRMRATFERLLTGLWSGMSSEMAEDRGLTDEVFHRLVDTGFLGPGAAVNSGLADDVLHTDEARDHLAEVAGGHLEDVDFGDYAAPRRRWLSRRPARIALVHLSGTIVPGETLDNEWIGQMCGAETVAAGLEEARDDAAVRAVVLRIDSPGGSGAASDRIWRVASLVRERKPLIVSMGDYAASGGYYVAVAADEIVAQPATITGSIGVFSGKFALGGLYDWLGLRWGVVQRGRNADIFNDRLPWTDEQRLLVRAQLEEFYARFLEVVATGRDLDPGRVAQLAGGRVYTGEEAVDEGLADALGGLPEAVQAARERARIDADTPSVLVTYPRRQGWMGALSSGGLSGAAGLERTPARRALAETLQQQALARETVLAWLPARVGRR